MHPDIIKFVGKSVVKSEKLADTTLDIKANNFLRYCITMICEQSYNAME